MYWIILTDASVYRIFTYEKDSQNLSLLEEKFHPESKEKISDLVTDRPGHYQTPGTTRGAYSEHQDPKKIENAHFSKELASYLEQGRTQNKYEGLILIAPPKANGLLLSYLSKEVKKLIISNLKKDYVYFTQHELIDFITKNWRELIPSKL
ncbi:MAG: uncharacterized protein K0Q74_787 [Gammaproteobacteria bacterium]|jgi:protein required for attachment to host cells|nr:uncharacterized protein [Gammaproteobacteria bacterium]